MSDSLFHFRFISLYLFISICLSVCLSMCLSLSPYLSVFLAVSLYLLLCVSLYVSLSTSFLGLSLCGPLDESHCLSVPLYGCLSLPMSLSFCLFEKESVSIRGILETQ